MTNRSDFEEWAEEALTEVGLADIDLFLQTVYNKANRKEQDHHR